MPALAPHESHDVVSLRYTVTPTGNVVVNISLVACDKTASACCSATPRFATKTLTQTHADDESSSVHDCRGTHLVYAYDLSKKSEPH